MRAARSSPPIRRKHSAESPLRSTAPVKARDRTWVTPGFQTASRPRSRAPRDGSDWKPGTVGEASERLRGGIGQEAQRHAEPFPRHASAAPNRGCCRPHCGGVAGARSGTCNLLLAGARSRPLRPRDDIRLCPSSVAASADAKLLVALPHTVMRSSLMSSRGPRSVLAASG